MESDLSAPDIVKFNLRKGGRLSAHYGFYEGEFTWRKCGPDGLTAR